MFTINACAGHITKVTGVLVLLASVASLTACSYATDFVIANNSTQILYVEYHVTEFPGDFDLPTTPSVFPVSQLSAHGNKDWIKLESGQYQTDSNQRTVSVSIMPGQARLVSRMHNYGGHSDPFDAKEFPLDRIRLDGASGVRLLNGEEARTSFSENSRALYVLEYR